VDLDIDTDVESSKTLSTLSKISAFSSSWTGTFIIVMFIIFFIAQAFVIPSGSMKRTLLIGDHLFVKKFAYGIPTPHIPFLEIPVLPDFDGDGHLINGDRPKRGDIVVFRYPPNPKQHFVKRCVAVAGDKLTVIDKVLYLRPHEGDEYIKANYPSKLIVSMNGELWVKDPYRYRYKGIQNDPNIMAPPLLNFPVTEVAENEYFMMGDNRDHSNDSRFWGAVPYKYIEGTPWFIYFSWDDDYKIRWNRIGHFVSTIENDPSFIDLNEPLE
jgi:signal peptidase I